jgi:hypothetical protein
MTVIKLTKGNIAKSVMMFIYGVISVFLVLFFMVFINEGMTSVDYIVENKGNLLTVAISIVVISAITYCYFFFENKAVLQRVSKIVEIFLLLDITLMICFLLGKYLSPTARPLAFFAFMCVTLYRRRDAIFLNTVFALIMLVIDRFSYITLVDMYDGYASLLTTFCCGIVGIFIFQRVRTRIESVLFALILLLPVEFVNCVLIIPVGDYQVTTFVNVIIFSALDCLFSAMLYMFLLPVFEVLFSELTVFRLRELTSDDAKLIKRLKNNAPGTYNHSVVVAQLVEACAKEIGENAELARAAAYYHDVGKLKNPEMFAENQTEHNFHSELSPELSVDIIRSHTRDGAQLIKKNKLPDFFADVAVQHHGTMPIRYFYAKALKMSDGELNIANYSYSGPTPTSKIAAILMICDAAEAATRSLPDRSADKVEALVRSLIEERLDLDQFDNCNITMRELSVIKTTIVDQLTGVYHSRVAYPKLTYSKKKAN